MSKPPKIVIPGMNRGAGVPAGYVVGRRRGKGKGPAELLDLNQMRGAGLQLVSASNQQTSSAISSGVSSVGSLSTSISASVSTVLTGYARLAAANVFTAAPQAVQGTGGITLQDTAASAGFSIFDRPTAPSHQVNFTANGAASGGVVLNVYAALSSAAAKSTAQIALFTVPPDAASTVQCVIRAKAGASGEEMILLTQRFGTTALTAGDMIFMPNLVEKLRILTAAGDPAVKVTGQLAVTDDPYAASWDGSADVPTKNAVYDKIETLGVWAPTVDGSNPPVFILDGSNQLIMTRVS